MVLAPVKTESQDLAERITEAEGDFGAISSGHQVAVLERESQTAGANSGPAFGCGILYLDRVAKLGATMSIPLLHAIPRNPSL